MPDRIDDILFRLDFTANNLQSVAAVQAQLVQIQAKSVELQQQQAATFGQLAQSAAAAETHLGNLPVKEAAASAATAAHAAVITAAAEAWRLVEEGAGRAFEVLKSISETQFQFEQWHAQFTVLEQDPDRARAKLEEFQQFAEQYNLNLPGVVNAGAILDRVGILGPESLRAVTAAAAVTGKDVTDVAERVAGASRGMFRGILDLLPAASSKLLAFTQDVEAGAKKSPETLRKYTELGVHELLTQYGAGLDEMSHLTENRLKGVGDKLELFRKAIADAGWGDELSRQVDHVLEEIERLKKDGTLDAWAQHISDTLIGTLHAAEDLGHTIYNLREPIIFLVGAYGLSRLAPVAIAVTGAITTMTEAMIAGEGAAVGLGLAIDVLGGGVPLLLGLIGGGLAVALAHSKSETDQLRESSARLDDQLRKTSARPAAQDTPLGPLQEQLKEAQKRVDDLEAARRRMVENNPTGILDPAVITQLEEARRKVQALKEERDKLSGTGGRDVPFTGPVNQVAAARQDLAGLYAVHPGESFSDYEARFAAGAAPPRPPRSNPDANARGKGDEEAFKKAVAAAEAQVKLEQDTEDKITAAMVDGETARIELVATSAQEKLALFTQYSNDAMAQSIALGEQVTKTETDIETRRQIAIAQVRGSSAAKAVQAEEIKAINEKAAAEKTALDAALTDGTLLLNAKKANAAESVKLAQDVAKEEIAAAQKVTADLVDSAKQIGTFEIGTGFATASDLVDRYTAALVDAKAGSYAEAEAQVQLAAALDLFGAAQKQANIDLAEFAILGVSAAKAAELVREGLKPTDVQNAGAASHTAGDQAADLAIAKKYDDQLDAITLHSEEAVGLIRAQWVDLFHELGFEWAHAAVAGQLAFATLSGAATGAYATIEKATAAYLKNQVGTHAIAALVAKNAAKEAAAAELDSIAAVMKAMGEQEAATAIRAVAWAIEQPWAAGMWLAAAAKHLAAAAAFGVGSAVAGGAAEGIRESEQQDNSQAAAAAGGNAGSSSPRDTSSRLKSVAGNAPITQNFTVSVNFYGGLNLFGPDAAIALLREMKPYLQQMLNDRELTVPGSGNG